MMPLCVCVLAVSLWSGGPGVQVLMSTDLSNCCPPEEGLRVCVCVGGWVRKRGEALIWVFEG